MLDHPLRDQNLDFRMEEGFGTNYTQICSKEEKKEEKKKERKEGREEERKKRRKKRREVSERISTVSVRTILVSGRLLLKAGSRGILFTKGIDSVS